MITVCFILLSQMFELYNKENKFTLDDLSHIHPHTNAHSAAHTFSFSSLFIKKMSQYDLTFVFFEKEARTI